VLASAFAARAELVDADTLNRELSVLGAAIRWWRGRGWIAANPITGIGRRPGPRDWTEALTREQITAMYALKADVREKTLWRLLYESCAWAQEILTLDIEDLVLPDKRGHFQGRGLSR
jgi:site-specific recombinase XerC